MRIITVLVLTLSAAAAPGLTARPAVAAGPALNPPAVTGIGAWGAAIRAPQRVTPSSPGTARVPAISGAQRWAERYNGPANGTNAAYSVAVSPNGSTVYVTGDSSGGSSSKYDYATVAYDAATGAQLWVSRYNGPASSTDAARSVAVSPNGVTVYVTGYSAGLTSNFDYATIAYDAATGAQLWVSRYNGPANSTDQAYSLAVSPGGGSVFVTGTSTGVTSALDYATVAYNAATGAQLWVNRYNGPANSYDAASSVAVGPAGGMVFVTGRSLGSGSGYDYATVAYNAVTGAQLWFRRYNGRANGNDYAQSVAVSPNGATVYVTGQSDGSTSGPDYATIAYNAATGAQRWVRRYNGPGNATDAASSVAVSPNGATVFVTGYSMGATSRPDYATVAYNTVTGAQRWVNRYNGPANSYDAAYSVAVSPDGARVYVTGGSYGGLTTGYDYATIAYDAATGAQLWVSRYNGPANSTDQAYSVAVSPIGGKVFVTGTSYGVAPGQDYATIAYDG